MRIRRKRDGEHWQEMVVSVAGEIERRDRWGGVAALAM
jgi:hypothetical protein